MSVVTLSRMSKDTCVVLHYVSNILDITPPQCHLVVIKYLHSIVSLKELIESNNFL